MGLFRANVNTERDGSNKHNVFKSPILQETYLMEMEIIMRQ